MIKPMNKKKILINFLWWPFLAVMGLLAVVVIVNWFAPPPVYAVYNIESIVSHKQVGRPQLSPDGEYLAYLVAGKTVGDDYLAITKLSSGETHSLAKMRFGDGMKWDLHGHRIIYQSRFDDHCQIRLLKLNENKQPIEDSRVGDCLANVGGLSFAWFNEEQFYVNLVDDDSTGRAVHQLYSFDLSTKQATRLLIAANETGNGFHALEYDSDTKTLYLLTMAGPMRSDFYAYRQGRLTKLSCLGYALRYFTVAADQLVYRNEHYDLVINQPANDFKQQKVLLASAITPITQPHISDYKLTFIVGTSERFIRTELRSKTSLMIGDKVPKRWGPERRYRRQPPP